MTGSVVTVRAGALVDLPRLAPPAPSTLVVADTNTAALVPADYAAATVHVVPAGETTKSWSELERLLLALDAAGIDRDGRLLAVGGGVVTDLGGLAASLHRRGLPWIAAPTSLVGQVDAAVGGKTAVNLGGGKNTVGSFHLPEHVVVDPTALATLPERHLRAGMAEVLKTALIAGGALYERVLACEPSDLATGSEAAIDIIEGCLAVKLDLVERDLRDGGPRQLLNLGHTFGHAFEALALPELLHGEAVALGLLCAARLAAGGPGSELENRLRDLSTRWGLPTEIRQDADRVLAEMGRDKKRRGARLTLVLPREPGRVEIVEGVDPDAVKEATQAVLAPF